MNPLVSICIPTFNGSKFLQDALDSIVKQTYKRVEVIVSDDSSTDNTLDIINEFKEKVNFPIYVFNHNPNGIGANWNNCISKANGEYIKFLFQDDVLFPSCIEEMLEVIRNEKKVGLVSCKRTFILNSKMDSKLKIWIENYKDLQQTLTVGDEKISFLDKTFLRDLQFLKSPLNKIGEPSAVMFNISVVKENGNFRHDLKQILDYEFYYRVLRNHKIAIINKDLIGFRIHPNQATNINRERKIDDYAIYQKILYTDFFKYLNFTEQKRLFFEFNRFGQFVKRFFNV